MQATQLTWLTNFIWGIVEVAPRDSLPVASTGM